MRSFYLVLGITRTASQDEVKKAFREKAKVLHPDHGGKEDDFKELSQAYATLSNPEKRRSYDLSIPDAPRPTTRPSYSHPHAHVYQATDWRKMQEDLNRSQSAYDQAYQSIMAQMFGNSVKQTFSFVDKHGRRITIEL